MDGRQITRQVMIWQTKKHVVLNIVENIKKCVDEKCIL